MKFLQDCLDFINAESKEVRKSFTKIRFSEEKDLLLEGTAIVKATYIGNGTFKFPPQFVKLRDDQTVVIFSNTSDKQHAGAGEIVSIDYLKHTVEVEFSERFGFKDISDNYVLIQDSCIYPKAVSKSLENMILNGQMSPVVENIINRKANIKTEKSPSVENIIKTANKMNNSFMVIHGPPGAGKTYTAKKVIADLMSKGKSVLITSNSHSAINNLVEAIEIENFKGAKICSREKHKVDHEAVKNIKTFGDEIDNQINGYQLVAGTCFALAKIQEKQFDYLFIDEASQIKLSFILAVAKIAKNVIIMGDHLQLTSISAIPLTQAGDAVLNYILEENQILPQKYGYFLDTTYRCEPQIAKVVSDVYYSSKLKWSQTKKKQGIELVTVEHNLSSKMNETEGKEVLKIYKSLIRKKVKPEDIMIIAPYNAQVAYIKSLIKNDKVATGTVDLVQGTEAKVVIMSFTVAGKSAVDGEFVTNSNRVNVAVSRAKDKVYLVMSNKLVKSEFTTPSFQKLLKMVNTK